MRLRVKLMLVVGLTLLGPASAHSANPEAGHALAKQWCTSCHIIEPGGRGSDAAPPFPVIANDPDVTAGGLRAWLADPHPPMPNLALSREEIEAIIDYLRSLHFK